MKKIYNQEIVNMKEEFIEKLMEKGFTRKEAEIEFQDAIMEWLGDDDE